MKRISGVNLMSCSAFVAVVFLASQSSSAVISVYTDTTFGTPETASSSTEFSVVSNHPSVELLEAYADQTGNIGVAASVKAPVSAIASWAETLSNSSSIEKSYQLKFGTGTGSIVGFVSVDGIDGGHSFTGIPFQLDGHVGLTYDVTLNGTSIWSSGIKFTRMEGDLEGTPGVDLRRSVLDFEETGAGLGGTLFNPGWIENLDAAPIRSNLLFSYAFDAVDFTLDLGRLSKDESMTVEYSITANGEFSYSAPSIGASGFDFGLTTIEAGRNFIFDDTFVDSYAKVVSKDHPSTVPLPASLPMLAFGAFGLIALGSKKPKRRN